MGDYMNAYLRRMKNNHDKLMSFAQELKKAGCKVYAVNHCLKEGELIDYIHVRRGNMAVNVGFAEVPYRWYIDSPYSGKVVYVGTYAGGSRNLGYEFPFTVEDVLGNLKESNKLDSMYKEI